MKNNIIIHKSSVERFYNDGTITYDEYKRIIDRIVNEKQGEADVNNG